MILDGLLQHVQRDFAVFLHFGELIGGEFVGVLDPGCGRQTGLHQLHRFFAGQLALGQNLVEDQAHPLKVGSGETGGIGDVLHEPFDVLGTGADRGHGGAERLIHAERGFIDRLLNSLVDLVELRSTLALRFQNLPQLVLRRVEGDQAVKAGLECGADDRGGPGQTDLQARRNALTGKVSEFVRLVFEVSAPARDDRTQAD